MTALDARPALTPPDPDGAGLRRRASEVRRGWHVWLDGVWRLVENADPIPARGCEPGVVLTVRIDVLDTRSVVLPCSSRLPTRTVGEQIRHVESLRVAQMPGLGLGPVSRIHFDEQILAAIADGIQKEER